MFMLSVDASIDGDMEFHFTDSNQFLVSRLLGYLSSTGIERMQYWWPQREKNHKHHIFSS